MIALTDWAKLSFVPGGAEICGPACAPDSADALVRVISLWPRGTRKFVFVNIAAFLSPEALARGTFALSDGGQACLGVLLGAEATALRAGAPPAGCDIGGTTRTLWRFWPA